MHGEGDTVVGHGAASITKAVVAITEDMVVAAATITTEAVVVVEVLAVEVVIVEVVLAVEVVTGGIDVITMLRTSLKKVVQSHMVDEDVGGVEEVSTCKVDFDIKSALVCRWIVYFSFSLVRMLYI